jgi:predicted acylesterase/phospholipase RssA
LTYLYTSGVSDRLVQRKNLIVALLGDSLAAPDGLKDIIAQNVTPELLGEIAAEYRKGRHLLVITTNMDAQRAAVWDMTRIAASGQPGALDLFRKVLLASASIPAVLPPVLIDVTANGRHFQEMHADGAAAAEFFTVPEGLLSTSEILTMSRRSNVEIYIVVNNTISPEFQVVTDQIIPIGARGLSTLIKSQLKTSLDATYEFTRRAGIKFQLASITASARYDPTNPFNLNYMKAVYEFGYKGAVSGQIWRNTPAVVPTAALPRITQ